MQIVPECLNPDPVQHISNKVQLMAFLEMIQGLSTTSQNVTFDKMCKINYAHFQSAWLVFDEKCGATKAYLKCQKRT